MSDFMIQYITRFKVRFENEIAQLGQSPLPQPALNELQLTRARRAVNAANAILAMGPNAVQIDHRKFENWRSILLFNSISYNKTQRQVEDIVIPRSTAARVARPTKPMRRR